MYTWINEIAQQVKNKWKHFLPYMTTWGYSWDPLHFFSHLQVCVMTHMSINVQNTKLIHVFTYTCTHTHRGICVCVFMCVKQWTSKIDVLKLPRSVHMVQHHVIFVCVHAYCVRIYVHMGTHVYVEVEVLIRTPFFRYYFFFLETEFLIDQELMGKVNMAR